MPTPTEVANRLGVSASSIRNWADRFAHHLSAGASPGRGRSREFSYDDLLILAAIHYYSQQGYTWDDVDGFLASGQYLNEDIAIPPPAPRTEREAMRALQVVQGVLRAVEVERDRLIAERDRLLAHIFDLERKAGYVEAVQEELRTMRAYTLELQARIIELERALARFQ